MKIVHYYRETEAPHSLLPSVKEQLKALGLGLEADKLASVHTESCFNVQLKGELDDASQSRLEWLLAETFDRQGLRFETSSFDVSNGDELLTAEFGPRMTFTSAFSSNAVSICQACGLPQVNRLERSRRYRFLAPPAAAALSDPAVSAIKSILHDRMTEQEYSITDPISTFEHGAITAPVTTVPIMTEGRAALEKINAERGLGFDDFDLDYYTNLFKVRLCVVLCCAVLQFVHQNKTESWTFI
jgi:phosphoribosylformylglycinamidine synthase